MRSWSSLLVTRGGGVLIDTLILLLFGVTALAFLTVAVIRMITHQRREKERARADGFPSGERPRTEEQKGRDKQTAMIWGCAALAVPAVLALAYFFTR
ncbi:hypothetical protein [Brachybacterium sp. P6-10-X1]|uniref:hypothetical protein n=1 Tax=Brachybacterium sp. P6-10-X1 TaxID=1903186 RepID=UPI0012F96C84|nr:hypothetical protein [Brachybacterium sp. P6-10-X1]